jgi:pilus assembly protein Flp/PilA
VKFGRLAMRGFAVRFLRNEAGTTSIEYVLIAALVAVGIISAVTLLGSQVSGTFNSVETEFKKV